LPFPDALQEFRVETSALCAAGGDAFWRVGQRRDESGTIRFTATSFEFLRDRPVQRQEPVCSRRSRRQQAAMTG
jgi:hypothetical protein